VSPPLNLPLEALETFEGCPRRYQLRFLEGQREPGLGAAPALASPRHRDRRVDGIRELLGALPVEAWRAGVPDEALATAAGRIGLTLAEAGALQLVRPLRRLARTLHGFTEGFSWETGVPFHLPLGGASVHGVFDLLLSGPPGDAAVCLVPGIQAIAGASASVLLEALRVRAPEGRQVRAALLAVDGQDERLHWASETTVAPAELEARLRSAASLGPALAGTLERHRCEALGCGFLGRCHPPERGL
jgi:hypothetical protein